MDDISGHALTLQALENIAGLHTKRQIAAQNAERHATLMTDLAREAAAALGTKVAAVLRRAPAGDAALTQAETEAQNALSRGRSTLVGVQRVGRQQQAQREPDPIGALAAFVLEQHSAHVASQTLSPVGREGDDFVFQDGAGNRFSLPLETLWGLKTSTLQAEAAAARAQAAAVAER